VEGTAFWADFFCLDHEMKHQDVTSVGKVNFLKGSIFATFLANGVPMKPSELHRRVKRNGWLMKQIMRLVKIIVEKTKDMYSSYAENVPGIYGGGDTVEEAKRSVLDAIRLLKSHNDKKNIPALLKGEYTVVYKYDLESFLRHYKGIFTNSGLERITGINQKQFQHYASGLKKPRPAQAKKIESALHRLGSELLLLEL
jgi:hypothetical protein